MGICWIIKQLSCSILRNIPWFNKLSLRPRRLSIRWYSGRFRGIIVKYLWWLLVEIHSPHVQRYRSCVQLAVNKLVIVNEIIFFSNRGENINDPWSTETEKSPFWKDVSDSIIARTLALFRFPSVHFFCAPLVTQCFAGKLWLFHAPLYKKDLMFRSLLANTAVSHLSFTSPVIAFPRHKTWFAICYNWW